MKGIKKIAWMVLISTIVILAGCSGAEIDVVFDAVVNGETATNAETVVETENHPDATETTILINETPVEFMIYEIAGEYYFSLEDLSQALRYTQARFWYWDDTSDWWSSEGTSYKYFGGRRHVTLQDIAPRYGFDVAASPESGMMIISTNEPYVSEHQLQIIADFLLSNYQQIFTREQVWEEWGSWSASSFWLFGLYEDASDVLIPGILIRFDDAGSWDIRDYMFIDGEYRMAEAPLYHFLFSSQTWDDELEVWQQSFTHDTYNLVAPYYQVVDIINQKLWPNLTTLPNGTIVDARLSDEIIALVFDFFEDFDSEWIGSDWIISEIKNSMISEGLLRIALENSEDGWRSSRTFWLEIENIGNTREVRNGIESWFWLSDNWHW